MCFEATSRLPRGFLNSPTLTHDYCLKNRARVFQQLGVSELSEMLGQPPKHSINFELQSIIDKLLQRANQNEDVRIKLDKHLPSIWLQEAGIATEFDWKFFVLDESDVFDISDLYDIGSVIRSIVSNYNQSNLLFRVVQYCMPYIKHNRLCFHCKPDDQDILIIPELMKIMLATCLALYPSSTKKPTWTNRVKICRVFMKLWHMGRFTICLIFVNRIFRFYAYL